MLNPERLTPHSEEAEIGVIGSVLLLPEAMEEVAPICRARDFYVDANVKLFGHLLAMYQGGEKIDSTLLIDRLKRSGDFELIGGLVYLGTIIDAVVNAAHAKYYAEIVQTKAQSRDLIGLYSAALGTAYDESSAPADQIKDTETKLQKIAERGSSIDLLSAHDALMQAIDYMAAAAESDNSGAVETGLCQLDAMLGGLHGGELTILAARPSNGKSALAQQIAEHTANLGETVLYFSMEMKARDLAFRHMAGNAQVSFNALRTNKASSEQRLRALAEGNHFGTLPILFRDASRSSTRDIRLATKQLIRQGQRPGLIVVDYLALLTPDDVRMPRHEQVGAIAKQLREIAKDVNVPVLCLCQLNRESESKGRKPRVADLRESGDIEAHSDSVVLLHREDMANPDDPDLKNKALAIVGKNRNGVSGEVPLFFDGDRIRFTALDPRLDDNRIF